MDINEMMTRDGMRDFTSGQRDTFVNDATEIRQIGLIFKARIAQTQIDGDKPWSARRRAHKVGRHVDEVARLLEKAAAKVEALDATYNREVLELPARRTKALEAKDKRREQRLRAKAVTRRKAQELTGRTLAETASAMAADPRTAGHSRPEMPPSAPPLTYVHPHAYTTPQTAADPLPEIPELFKEVG